MIAVIVKIILWAFVFLIVTDVILYLLVRRKERKRSSSSLVSGSTSAPDLEGESVISSGSDDSQPERVCSD